MLNLDWNILDGRIFVAVSGGADSVALLLALHERLGASIEALHCNFHLRGEESERDEAFVERLCQRLGVKLHVKHFETREYAAENGVSIEMAARELRYAWFRDMLHELKADMVAVAHHREDQAETVLLNLIRGTGLRGMVGMQKVNGCIVRPMLNVSKADILSYLKERGEEFVTDSSNLERDAQRNRLRLDVMPLLNEINPQAIEHIAQAAHRVAEALPYFERGINEASELTETVVHERLRGCGFTTSQEADIARCERTGATFESPTHRAIVHRGQLIVEQKTKEQATPRLRQELVATDDAMKYLHSLPLGPEKAYIDADLITGALTLRHPTTGDRFRPFGMKRGTRLVADFLSERGLSRYDRERQWLVCMGEDIVWVCNQRPDARFCITAKTRNIMILSLEEA